MGGISGNIQKVVLRGASGTLAEVDSSGNLQTDVNNTVDVNIISGGGVTTVDTDDSTAQFDIAAVSTTLVNPVGTDKVRLHKMYVATSSTMIPCTWSFKFGAGSDLFETYFASRGARVSLNFSPALEGDDGEDLTFTANVINTNLRVTIVYEEV